MVDSIWTLSDNSDKKLKNGSKKQCLFFANPFMKPADSLNFF
jgi:hypothetical protein